jgi:hypothetical protein
MILIIKNDRELHTYQNDNKNVNVLSLILQRKRKKTGEIRYDFCHPTRQIYAVLPIKGMQLFYLHQSDNKKFLHVII